MKGYKKNKLQQLRGFCAVIEEGTVQKASEKMNTAQSNVSLQISSLEKDIGMELFKREKQRLYPTPEALRFYKVCKKTLADIDFIFKDASSAIKQDYDNKIRIAAHPYMLSHILPPYFKKLVEVNSKAQFELHNVLYEEGLELLKAGGVDIAIFPVSKKTNMKNLINHEFYKCEFGIGLYKNHPLAKVKSKDITWNMLSKYDFCNIGKGISTQGLKSELQNYSINSRFNLINGTWEICLGLVKEGLTISGTDKGYALEHKDVIRKICPHLVPQYSFSIILNRKSNITIASNELLTILGYSFSD